MSDSEADAVAAVVLAMLRRGAAAAVGGCGGGSCCDDVCSGVGAGTKQLVCCDGTGMALFQGTADGQYPSWDNTTKTWVLANV